MPNKKSHRVAARQAELRQRARQKLRRGPVAPPPQYVPPPAPTEAPSTEEAPQQFAPAASAPTTAPSPSTSAPIAASSARAPRRERAAEVIQRAASLRTELLRIGIVAVTVAGILVGLKLGTDLGA